MISKSGYWFSEKIVLRNKKPKRNGDSI